MLFYLQPPMGANQYDWTKACTYALVLGSETECLGKIFSSNWFSPKQVPADLDAWINDVYEYSIIQRCETTLQWMLQQGYRCNSRVCSIATTSLNLDRLRKFLNLLSDPTLENVEFMAPKSNTQAYKRMLVYLYTNNACLTDSQKTRARELEILDILKKDTTIMVSVLPNDITELIFEYL
jgi:hypothetical protein